MNWNRTLLTKLFFGFVNLKLLKFIILIMKEYKWKMYLNVLKYRFAYLTNKINKSFPWFWNTLFRPVSELELSDSSALSISSICHLKKLVCDTWVLLLNLNDSTDLKLSKNVLRHIIFCQGVNNKILVSCRSFTWPILGTFFLIKIITWFFFSKKIAFLPGPFLLVLWAWPQLCCCAPIASSRSPPQFHWVVPVLQYMHSCICIHQWSWH